MDLKSGNLMKIHALITGAKLEQTAQSAWRYVPSAAQTHGCINLLDFLLQDQKLHRHCFPQLIIFYMAKNGIPKKLNPGSTIELTKNKNILKKNVAVAPIFCMICLFFCINIKNNP